LKMSIYVIQIAIGLLGVGFGLYWPYKAFATGRALGRFGFANRATRPVGFWLHVVMLSCIVAISSLQVAVPVLKEHGGFHALHSAAASGAMVMSPVSAAAAPGCSASGSAVCFVAAGAAPDVPVETLARYYTTLLGAPVGVLAPVALTREADALPLVNTKRSQVGIDALTRLVRDTYPALWGKGVTVVIFTGNDLWLEDHPGSRYSFGGASSRRGGGGFAVVSAHTKCRQNCSRRCVTKNSDPHNSVSSRRNPPNLSQRTGQLEPAQPIRSGAYVSLLVY
jgi:hypothetical protein